MSSKNRLIRRVSMLAAVSSIVFFMAACQTPVAEVFDQDSETIPAPSPTEVDTPVPTDTAVPTDTLVPTETIPPTPTQDPCARLWPVDEEYSNPQENLDPETGLTWMMITLDEGILQPDYRFSWWWDTRAFQADLSFNKGSGTCDVLLETNQIRCEGLPLSGTDSLPSGGYEYTLSLYIQDYGCNAFASYHQGGLLFMRTMEHDVYVVNQQDAH